MSCVIFDNSTSNAANTTAWFTDDNPPAAVPDNMISNTRDGDVVTSVLTIESVSLNVTEYWKTDHVRTFGQLLFIGPANSHTHTLPVHCCINGLS